MDNQIEKEQKERIDKWNNIRINQFGFLTNLILTLSLGFTWFLLQVNELYKFYYFVICLFIISIIIGLFLWYNRLKDFRETVKKIRWKTDITSDDLNSIWKTSRCLLILQLFFFWFWMVVLLMNYILILVYW